MKLVKKAVEEVTITCNATEVQDALDYCTQGSFKIVRVDPARDGRSHAYGGELTIVAVRVVGDAEGD